MADGQGNRRGNAYLASVLPTTWANPGTDPWNALLYPDVLIQIVGTPSTPYTPTFSLDGVNYVACEAFPLITGAAVTSISATGIYRLPGFGWLKFSAGAGSTITIRAGS